MNIHELDKQATPGPFKAVANRPDEDGGKLDRIKVPDGSNVAFIPDHEHTYQQEQANALMFAHCRSNFMKAIEALKDARSALQHHGLYGDATSVNAVIEELEDVKA